MTDINLSQLIDTDAKAYAIYTVENRAIPNIIDGLKPVQRFVLYRAIESGKSDRKKFFKLASIAGGVADAGYHHGEASAQDAGVLMANTWNNNYPILDGQGNFGSRLVQEAAASRYIFCRAGNNFFKMYKDEDVTPFHEDPEHLPPKFYLPVIPMVLINGVLGIATGYATNILPHSVQSVIECTRLAVLGKLDKEPDVSYPKFSGDIKLLEQNKYEIHGTYKLINRKLHITEIPYQYDRASYVEILDALEDKNLISYEDDCSKNGFGFKITLRKDYKLPLDKTQIDKKIKQDFKLIQRVSQNIVVIDEKGKLVDNIQGAADLIQRFVVVRKEYVGRRITKKVYDLQKRIQEITARISFIDGVVNQDIIVKGKTKQELVSEVSLIESIGEEYADKVVGMPIYQMTKDEIAKLNKTKKELLTEQKYWKNTTINVEYLKDIEELEKVYASTV